MEGVEDEGGGAEEIGKDRAGIGVYWVEIWWGSESGEGGGEEVGISWRLGRERLLN